MKRVHIPTDQAIVLQHINELGEDDFVGLARALRMGRARLANIIQILHHKRLIVVQRSAADIWVRLSAKGRAAMRHIWPEAARWQH